MKKNIYRMVIVVIFSSLFLGCGGDRVNASDDNSSTIIKGESTESTQTEEYDLNLAKRDSDRDGLSDSDEIEKYHTDPNNPDTDGDCLLDGYEVNYYKTDVTKKDTDGDNIPDGIEIYSFILGEANLTCLYSPETEKSDYIKNPPMDNLQSPDVINALDPRVGFKDSDGDGISDKDERDKYGTDPLKADTDGDGLSDGEEVLFFNTDPLKVDTDGDGLEDGYEINSSKTDPLKADKNIDSDRDGLFDNEELTIYHTDPNNPDTDGDCLLDGYEIKYYKTDVLNKDTDEDNIPDGIEIYSFILGEANLSCLYSPETEESEYIKNPPIDNLQSPDVINALDSRVGFKDSDGDGVSDKEEIEKYGTDPFKADSDGDGISDGEELLFYRTDPLKIDSDGDGINDNDEINKYKTDPTNSDTDGDGLDDGYEINTSNTDPLIPNGVKTDDTQEGNDGNETSTTQSDGLSDGNGTASIDNGIDSDGDGLSDEYEKNNKLNPFNPDSDGDGLDDGYEIEHKLNPLNDDTDGDGLNDGDEVNIYGTEPNNADSDDDNLTDGYEVANSELNATNPDTDGDGLSDGDEINIYGTSPNNADSDDDNLTDGYEIEHSELNATNPDTDGDGLDDGVEVNQYHTLPNKRDSDDDGLTDIDEINNYLTNPLNADTDEDCLLDGFEILQYETNATNKDTDGDGVDDGIEIYANSGEELNISCLTNPETLEQGYNKNPAIDGIPDASTDIINALDPTNDSDGDGQSNIKENNCTEGDPNDATKQCLYITETNNGKLFIEHGYAYIPGGFDVDGDGVEEGGFWISRFQARRGENTISMEDVVNDIGNVNQYVSKNFKVLNKNIEVTNYDEKNLEVARLGVELIFDEEKVTGKERITNFTPYLALVCLHRYQLKDKNESVLDYNITLPTLKQYVHVKMLLDADLANNGDGRHIRNGILGVDPNIPIYKYNLIVDEFGENKKEYLRNLVQLRNINEERSFVVEDIPDWWEVDPDKFNYFNNGANSTQDFGFGIGPDKDPYAVIVRGGEILDVTEGVSGALTDDEGDSNGISFRAATPYLY